MTAHMRGVFTAHGTDANVCAATYFWLVLVVHGLTSWCFDNQHDKIRLQRKR